eukprot:TRINITY_DN19344_c0_g2_i1.p1 TRINITY_DN19344_c0_g2~~TRINITY_DN19344_c0_g2_i1.p1  ORF type:complete len:519 (-),score=143.44 TRINITY_DN19344_c0_g2_i1:844-2400(-)
MANTLLEQTRAMHEENERLERIVVKDLQMEVHGHKERLHQNHRVKNFVDQIVTNSARLADIYEDNDGARKDEIAALGGAASVGQNVFSAFYDRLKEMRDYHRKHPGARAVESHADPEELIKEEPHVDFSGEEAFGRFVDMHELYQAFTNSKFGNPMEYSVFLEQFQNLHKIPTHLKYSKSYKDYTNALLEYLSSFFKRTQPLQPFNKIMAKVEQELDFRWENAAVPGWEEVLQRSKAGQGEEGVQQSIVDLQEFDTMEELLDPELVPPEKIKQALAALGLKTGGTPQQRAERLLLTKDTPVEQLDPRHFAKGATHAVKRQPGEGQARQLEAGKVVALVEAKVRKLCELLKEPIADTKSHLEKKTALTYEELEAERVENEAAAVPEDSDDEDDQIYNPLKLPMGWDGKPIPYWLYKLHGLGQEYKCEICGNYSYWGRRAFERHFKEQRHQHGMRCLGIPNTKNFNEVTVIKDAEALWEKIKEKQGVFKWRPEVEEEYEDTEGNVYNRKTYTDLQKQGLL